MTQFELSKHAMLVLAERKIDVDWIQRVLEQPELEHADPLDPQLRHAASPIDERGGRMLRVVYNHTTDPVRVVTAFFDRRLGAQR